MSSVSDDRVLGGGPDEVPRVACAGVAQRGGYVRPGGRSSSSRRAVVLSECLLSDQRKLDRLVCRRPGRRQLCEWQLDGSIFQQTPALFRSARWPPGLCSLS